MSDFGQDANGLFKPLPDGRVLRVGKRMFNALLTISVNREAQWWIEGW